MIAAWGLEEGQLNALIFTPASRLLAWLIKIPFIDVFYHQSSERHPGHTARAPPLSRGGRVRTGDQTTATPMP